MMQKLVARRSFATLRQALLKKNSGTPFEAYEVSTMSSVPPAKDKAVKVKLLSAVVTSKDVQAMQISSAAVGKPVGHAGLFEVVESAGSKFQRGEKVVSYGTVGAWQTEQLADETAFVKASSSVTARNFCDFIGHAQAFSVLRGANLKSGDTIVVSEAQSPLGLGLIRVGKKMGLKVVAVVASRAQSDKAMQRLKDAGADIVAAEQYVNKSYVVSHAFRRLLSDIAPARIAVDGIGSLIAHELARTLAHGGVLYVSGGAPLTLPTSLFVEKKIIVRGLNEPSANDFEEAGNMLVSIESVATPLVEFDIAEVAKAVDAVGFGPVPILKA